MARKKCNQHVFPLDCLQQVTVAVVDMLFIIDSGRCFSRVSYLTTYRWFGLVLVTISLHLIQNKCEHPIIGFIQPIPLSPKRPTAMPCLFQPRSLRIFSFLYINHRKFQHLSIKQLYTYSISKTWAVPRAVPLIHTEVTLNS